MSAVRHKASTVARARELRDAGWTVPQIQRVLRQEIGAAPAQDTITRWTNPAYAEKRAAAITRRNRKRWADRWTFKLSGAATSPEYRAAFMRRLDEEGVPDPSIAKVCSVVFGEPVTVHDVKVALAGGLTRSLRAAA